MTVTMMLKKPTLQSRLQMAHKAARMAGDVIMSHYAGEKHIQTKSSSLDLVTHVDLESDALIRDLLGEMFPEDTLVTEETYQEGHLDNLDQAWIVDPLDGTTNYAHSFPYFAVSIAYVEKGQPQIAVVFDPFKNELFTAVGQESGLASKNGLPIHVSKTEELGGSLLATGFPYDVHESTDPSNNLNLHERFLKQTHGIRRAGAAALDLAYVASGRLDGFWEYRLAPWDVAAGMLLVQLAGGGISDFKGEPINLAQRTINIVASNGKLHDAMVSVTKEIM